MEYCKSLGHGCLVGAEQELHCLADWEQWVAYHIIALRKNLWCVGQGGSKELGSVVPLWNIHDIHASCDSIGPAMLAALTFHVLGKKNL
jgi:hypothetical protein